MRKLKLVHIFLLCSLPVFFSIYEISVNDMLNTSTQVEIIVSVFSIIWASIAFGGGLIVGDEEQFLKKVKNSYPIF